MGENIGLIDNKEAKNSCKTNVYKFWGRPIAYST